MEENVASFVRKKYDGNPNKRYLTLGEMVNLQYKGHQINVADLATKLKNGKLGRNPTLMEIIKKRASYQQYLSNRQKRKEEKKFGEINYPEVHFPKLIKS